MILIFENFSLVVWFWRRNISIESKWLKFSINDGFCIRLKHIMFSISILKHQSHLVASPIQSLVPHVIVFSCFLRLSFAHFPLLSITISLYLSYTWAFSIFLSRISSHHRRVSSHLFTVTYLSLLLSVFRSVELQKSCSLVGLSYLSLGLCSLHNRHRSAVVLLPTQQCTN